MMEVGTVFAVVAPVGVNGVPVGTVIRTGDQIAAAVAVAVDDGFNAAHVAVEPVTAVPQLYPHIGTTFPSGRVRVVGAAVRLICANAVTAPTSSIAAASTAAFTVAFK